MAVLIIEDLVSRKWITEIVSVEETSTQVQVAFTAALEAEGLLQQVDARHADGLVDVGTDEEGRPILLAVSDNGPQMTSGSTREFQAPLPGGPTAEVLVDEQAGAGRLAATHLTILPGGGMAEHAHGDATALLVPLDSEVLIRHGDHEEKVTVGVVVLLDQAERVSLVNQTNEPASLLAVFAPADFVPALGGWPAATEPGARDGG